MPIVDPVTVVNTIKPKNNNDFGLIEDIDLIGGFRAVDTLAARDAIPVDKLKLGAFVFVTQLNALYRVTDLDPLTFVQFTSGAGDVLPDPATDLWVDPVNGNDAALGSQAAPLATIQKAVDRFFPPSTSPRQINRNTTLTVHVIYTSGMPALTERVHVPPRKGNGVLVIEGEEEILASVTYTSFTSLASFEVRRVLNITGSLSAAYNDESFVKRVAHRADQTYEHGDSLPVVDGASRHVVAAEPGLYTAEGWAANEPLQHVRPRIVWNCAAESRGTPALGTQDPAPMVVNGGGNLIIRGFEVRADNAGQQFYDLPAFVKDLNGASPYQVFGRTQIVRCVFKPGATGVYFGTIASGAVALIGCIARCAGGLADVRGASINVRWRVNSDVSSFVFVDDVVGALIGLDMSDDSTSPLGALFVRRSRLEGVYADFRKANVRAHGFTNIAFYALTVENAPSSGCVLIGAPTNFSGNRHSEVNMVTGSRIRGTSGNGGPGVTVFSFGFLASPTGTPTLAGTSGQVKVGDLAVATWAAGSLTDPTVLARYKRGAP